MKVLSLHGHEEVNGWLTSAMTVTVQQLLHDGEISQEVADKFLDENVCMAVDECGAFRAWVKRIFGDSNEGAYRILIANLGSKPENTNG